MSAKTSVSVAVLTTVVDNLKQQVHSAVDVFCKEALRTRSSLTADGLETAIVTLSAVLDQMKDNGDQASTDLSKAELSSTVSSSTCSRKEVTAVEDETQNVLLSKMNKLERSVLEVMQKAEQMEERQKVLDATSATKTELCDMQDQLTSRMCPLESSLKRLESDVQSRFEQMAQEVGMSKRKLRDLERGQLEDSESMGHGMNKVKLTITELDKKILDLKDAMSSAEADVCVLTGNLSQVQEKMSDIEKQVSQVGNRMSNFEEKVKKTNLKEKHRMKILSSKNDQLTRLIEKKVDNLEKLKTVLNQLKDRTTERDALSSKVDQMEQNLSQLSQTVGKLHQTMSPPPIAFCARQAEDKDFIIKKGEMVKKFSKLVCNAGNALDATEGIFTAPRDGLYGISAQAVKVIDGNSEFIQVAVVRRRISSGVEEDIGWLPIEREESSISITSVVRLKAGDEVFLDVTHAYKGAELSWISTFAGWLIR